MVLASPSTDGTRAAASVSVYPNQGQVGVSENSTRLRTNLDHSYETNPHLIKHTGGLLKLKRPQI